MTDNQTRGTSDTDTTDAMLEGAGRHAAYVFARQATADLARATDEWMRSAYLSEARLLPGGATLRTHRAGHMFEFMASVKFNASAAKAGDLTRAIRTAAVGRPHDAVDIEVTRGEVVLQRIQAKFSSQGPKHAAVAQADTKYEGMGRLVAADHAQPARDALDASVSARPDHPKAEIRRDARDNIIGEIREGSVTPGGTTVDEVHRWADDPVGWLRSEQAKAVARETGKAALAGFAGAALFTAAGQSARLALRSRHEDLDLTESIIEIATVSALAGLKGGGTSGMAKLIEIGARNTDVFSSMAETTAPIAIASAVLDIGTAGFDFLHGEITRDELVDRCAGVAIRNAGSWAFGVVGQTLIPVPVVGALVGSTVGYVTSALVLEGFKMARAAANEADAAEARLLEIESAVISAVLSLEDHRLAVEHLVAEQAAQFEQVLLPAMDAVERSLLTFDDAGALQHLVSLNVAFGTELGWRSLPEFDEFMADTTLVFEL